MSKRSYPTVPPKPFKLGTVAYITIDGVRRRVDVIPYTYGTFKKYGTDAKGKRVLREHERALYDIDGIICRHVRKPVAFEGEKPVEWEHVYEPYTGRATGRVGTGMPALIFRDGDVESFAA